MRCHFHERVEGLPPPRPPKQPDRPSLDDSDSILRLDGVAISYAKPGIVDQILGRRPDSTPAVDKIDLAIRRGETLGLVGESGSGKSTILRAIAGLWPPRSGAITYDGDDNLNVPVDARTKDSLRRVQLVDRVAVLYQGRLCEVGPSRAVYRLPSHPYTEVLLGAVLEPDADARPTLAAEDLVDLFPPARGCPFQRRCPRRIGNICDDEAPPWRPTELGHEIRCHIPPAELHGMQEQSANAVAAK